jgi:hypothetical protein
MARECVNKGFVFLFLYTREAHPGENFPAHQSMEQKLAHASAFQERFQIERPILVDDLVGTGHKLYGMLPNMTYVIGRGGKILSRADWTDPPTIEWTVQYIQSSRARRREDFHIAPFYAEIVGYRWNSPANVMEGLRRAGPKAVEDYERAMEHRKKQGPVPGRIKIDD